MTESKTFFITGGGTGGHIYPAVAIAKALIETGHKVFFVGNKKNLEYKICKDNNIAFLPVDVDFMPRKLSPKFLLWGLKTAIAGANATLYALKHKPNAIFLSIQIRFPIQQAAEQYLQPTILHHNHRAMPEFLEQ